MAGRRIVTLGLLGAAGAGGYYLYTAGGDPKVAQKQLESDAAKVSSKVRDELPGKANEAKQNAKQYGQEAGSKIDNAMAQAKAEGKNIESQLKGYSSDAQKKLEEARKETGDKLNQAVDKFDKTVEDGTSKAKSGISSWFK